jgi:cytochrome c oxidase subunit 4
MAAHVQPLADHDLDADLHGHHPPGGLAKYLAVFVALCILTGISYGVGNSQTLRENSPGVMWAMMMAVSCAKAMLVIMFFMHLLWEANWKYVLTIPASLMSIFLLLMLIPDIGRRTEKYADERWLYAPTPQQPHGHAQAPAVFHEARPHDPGEAPTEPSDASRNEPPTVPSRGQSR